MTDALRIIGLLGLICLSGCGGNSEQTQVSQFHAQASMAGSDAQDIGFQTIDASQYSGIAAAQTSIVRNELSWENLWREHKKNEVPPPPVPFIDFSQQLILAVFLGARSSGCYSVQIQKVHVEDKTVVVEYEEGMPQPDSICTQALTFPAHIVVIPQTTLPIKFVKAS